MKQARVLTVCGLCLLFALASRAWGINELKLGTVTVNQGDSFTLPLTLQTDEAYPVQGFVFSARWLASQMDGLGIERDAATLNADTFIARTDHAIDTDSVDYGFAVLGVVIDSQGTGKPPLPTGAANAVAKVDLMTKVAGTIDVKFVDGKYNTAPNSQVMLENIFVAGQRSFGVSDMDQAGNPILTLTNGQVISQAPPTVLAVPDMNATYGQKVSVPVLLSSPADVQGLVFGVKWAADAGSQAIALSDAAKPVVLGTDAAAADYLEAKLFGTDGLAAAIVMVLQNTGSPDVIPAGSKKQVATIAFNTAKVTQKADCTWADSVYHFTFNDFDQNSWYNQIVVNGQSVVAPELTFSPGALTVKVDPKDPTCTEIPPPEAKLEIAAGSCEMIPDPREGREQMHVPGPISANPGEPFWLGVFYRFPESVDLNEGVPVDQQLPSDLAHEIQGMSAAMCYDNAYLSTQAKYTLDGSITQQVGAEWVNVHARDKNDDPQHPTGELVIGILLDVVPPYDGQYLPATDDFLKLMCVEFTLLQDVCQNGKPQQTQVTFCDGAVGAGTVPVRNLAAVGNYSWPLKPFSDADIGTGFINVVEEPWFIRGDCNFSEIDHRTTNTSFTGPEVVDIADPAAVISYLFQPDYWKFSPPCLDACDANDDGRVDLADALFILRYLFKFGPKPTYPFDTMGPDSDRLPPDDPRYHKPDHLPACANPTSECRP